MAAIPNAGGARYAPRGVMRALVRLLVLGGLVAAGWLLGSGISYADEDLGQPSTGLIHLLSSSIDGSSGDQFGVSPSVGPIVKKVLSRTSVPRLSVRPPAKAGILQSAVNAVNAVSGSKPLTKVLTPVVRPLYGPTPYRAAVQPPVHADSASSVLPSPPAVRAPAAAPAAPTPAVVGSTPKRTATPVVALCSHAEDSPAEVPTGPALVPISTGDGPVAPPPASPPGGTPSSCTIGGSGGGTSTKNTTDVAVRDGWTMADLVQQPDLHSRDTSDLPRSLSAQPSTSPD